MSCWIALIRGINVGGRKRLPMKSLVETIEGIGGRGVQTYGQSGNAVFRHDEDDRTRLATAFAQALAEACDFRPRVMFLRPGELRDALADNPFPDAAADPSRLHLAFLEAPPDEPALDRLEGLRSGSERFSLSGSVFFLHAPDGIGRSKLAAGFEQALGVAATVRNYRTLRKVAERVDETQPDD